MKKVFLLILSLLMAFSLASCGEPKSLADIDKIFYVADDGYSAPIRIDVTFVDDGHMRVSLYKYYESASSPSGWQASGRPYSETDFPYSLSGDNYIIVDQRYYYTLDSKNLRVRFSVDFLGLPGAKEWQIDPRGRH